MILAGVDIGGTFTDIVVTDTRTKRSYIHKVPTTDDPSEGMVQGLVDLADRISLDTSKVEHIFHDTTIATNAVP